ncbi:MAG: HigA family addiction module antitoxin [Candidatus Sulfotelmatobacter sp.]
MVLYISTNLTYSGRAMNPSSLFDNTPVHPGKILKQKLGEKGWSQGELAAILGVGRQTVYLILAGKTSISKEMAVKLSAAFGNPAAEWLKWDSLYKLAVSETDASGVGKMARLYGVAPVRDMQRRGWLNLTVDPVELENELKRFFGVVSLDADIAFPVATKRTMTLSNLNPAEKAWCFRARQLAQSMIVAPFQSDRLAALGKKLRRLAAYPKEARHLARLLSEYGIRFVVIEPLPGVKIDGAAFWIDDNEPAIALSLRHDRIDGFWFTVMHEYAHIRAGDAISVDTDLVDEMKGISVALVEDEAERLANDRAADALVPKTELWSFISRVGPYYSRERVIQFAHTMKIHPGIVVGQLQYRKELGYSALRELLPKIRDAVIGTALTDGWNQVIAPASV